MATELRTIDVTIARVNDHGFQTQENPGRWWNLSKYAVPAPTIPPAGTVARIKLDGDSYVRAIEPISAPPTPAVSNGTGHQPPTKDTAIVRMAALKAAVRLVEPGAPTGDVLALAAKLEAWIVR